MIISNVCALKLFEVEGNQVGHTLSLIQIDLLKYIF